MDSDNHLTPPACSRRHRTTGSSYKFERLRERIRDAVGAGELKGKLPGERILARRFHVNAKTLSKALTDLAVEGLLERSVGRGTYVAGQLGDQEPNKRWLILIDRDCSSNALVTEVLKINPQSRPATAEEVLRPSLVSQFSVVINCASMMPQNIYRGLAVRGIPVIETSRLPQHYSMHGALPDRHLAAFNLGRDLLLGGHSRLAAMDAEGSTAILNGLSQAARRYGNGIIETLAPEQIPAALEDGTTGFVCDGVDLASQTLCMLNGCGVSPGSGQISLCAVGTMGQDICCSGYYVDPVRHAAVVAELAGELRPHHTSLLWLTGTYIDRGTLSARLERFHPRDVARTSAMIA